MKPSGRITVKRRAVAGYTAIPPSASGGGSSLAPWFSNVATSIQALQGTLVAATLVSDCVSLSIDLETVLAVGTGTATISTSIPGGVIAFASGATANSFQIVENKNKVTEPIISNMRTAKWAIVTRTQMTLTGTTSMLYQCGITDGTAVDAFLGQKTSVSGTNYVLAVGATVIDTGVAFDTSKNYTLAMIGNGTTVQGYLGAGDGTGIVAIGGTVAQSNGGNLPAALRLAAFNQATAANCSFNVDSILVLTERAA